MQVLLLGVDGMGCTKAAGQGKLIVVQVNRNDGGTAQ